MKCTSEDIKKLKDVLARLSANEDKPSSLETHYVKKANQSSADYPERLKAIAFVSSIAKKLLDDVNKHDSNPIKTVHYKQVMAGALAKVSFNILRSYEEYSANPVVATMQFFRAHTFGRNPEESHLYKLVNNLLKGVFQLETKQDQLEALQACHKYIKEEPQKGPLYDIAYVEASKLACVDEFEALELWVAKEEEIVSIAPA